MNISSADSSQYGDNQTTVTSWNFTDTETTADTPWNATYSSSSALTSGYETRLPAEGASVSPEAVDILSTIAETMSLSDVIEEGAAATTSAAGAGSQKVALFTDMQLHFLVVGGLFLVVVVLALVNLYIHLRTSGRSHGFEVEQGRMGMKAAISSGTGGGKRGAGGYTVKMKAKPSLFI